MLVLNLLFALALALAPARAQETCAGGRLVTTDSLGHCCWEGQAWNGSACVGRPVACPDGLRVDAMSRSCVDTTCPDGQERLSSGNCCWPGQVWSTTDFSCEGTPTACPEGFSAREAFCIPGGDLLVGILGTRTSVQSGSTPAEDGTCPEGQALAADGAHCCLPGEGWSSLRGYCVGAGVLTKVEPGASPKDLPTNGDPVLYGALEKSLIDAVVKRNLTKVKDCYARELKKNRRLGGKIAVKFIIQGDGSVLASETKSTTMNNAAVEQCINDVFLTFQFPETKGGGIVIVTYPFIFAPR